GQRLRKEEYAQSLVFNRSVFKSTFNPRPHWVNSTFVKSYILLLLLGLSVAFPQEAAKAEVLENADSKVETTAEPLVEDLVTEPEGDLADLTEGKTVEVKVVEEKQLREGADAESEGDFLVGEEILEGEIVPQDEVEYTCEYTDSSQTPLKIRFVKDKEGVEHALDIDGAETENIDEKLKECLEQDLAGRRNIKGVKRRKGGKRRRIRGNPRTVTMKEMKSAIRLAQRFMAVKGKEARRRKVLRKKAMGKKRRKEQKKNVKG
ncbi:hypothetical protein Anas_00475, partial [Armadillidium nasatum]